MIKQMNNISLTNTATNAVSALTEGSAGEYMVVSAGDVIKIAVASTAKEETAEIDIAVQCYLGTEADPVPVIKKNIDLSFPANASIVFAADAGKTVTLSDDGASLVIGTQTYTPTQSAPVVQALTGEGEKVLFAIVNNQDTLNGVTVTVQ